MCCSSGTGSSSKRAFDRRDGKHLPSGFGDAADAILDRRLDILFVSFLPGGAPKPSEILENAFQLAKWEYEEQAGDFDEVLFVDECFDLPEPSDPNRGWYVDSRGRGIKRNGEYAETLAGVFNSLTDGRGRNFRVKAKLGESEFRRVAKILGHECVVAPKRAAKHSADEAEILRVSSMFRGYFGDRGEGASERLRDAVEGAAHLVGFAFLEKEAVEKLKHEVRDEAFDALRANDGEKLRTLGARCGKFFEDSLLALHEGEKLGEVYDDSMMCAMLESVYDIERDKFDVGSGVYKVAEILAEEKFRNADEEERERMRTEGIEPVGAYEKKVLRKVLLSLPREEFDARWGSAYEWTRARWRRALEGTELSTKRP